MHKDLVLEYIELQALAMTPIAPYVLLSSIFTQKLQQLLVGE